MTVSRCAVLGAFALLLGAAPAVAQAPDPLPAAIAATVDTLRDRALASNEAYDIVESLTTEVGPRLAGSPEEARARAWAEAMLRERGFANIRIEPFEIPFWDATLERAEIIAPTRQRMVVAALGGSPSTPRRGLEAEIVRFESLDALDRAGPEAVAGKIVFIDEPMMRTQSGVGYGLAVRKRGQCAPRAGAKGALACVIRSVGTDHHRQPHQGGSARQPNGASLPAASLSPPDADQLARLLARGPVRIRLELQTEMRERAPSGNVIAEVVGREKPEEIVLIGAHLDSWDMGTGAIDDGAGVAIVVAAARLIQQLPQAPRRTVRVVLFGSEETGVHGGAAYAEAHAGELANHVLAAESDFGADVVYQLRSGVGEDARAHIATMARALSTLGVAPGDNSAGGGADVGAMHAAGVPVLDLDQSGWDYFDYHHTPDDTLDKIDPATLRQNVAAYAIAAYLAAEMAWDFRAAP